MNSIAAKYVFLVTCLSIIGFQSFGQVKKLSLVQHPPIVLQKQEGNLFQYWEVENQPYLWASELGEVQALQAYRDSIAAAIGDTLLRAMIQKERTQEARTGRIKKRYSNYDLIHKSQIGNVRPINFLEAELLNYQSLRFPLFTHPTEFHCFVLKNDSLNLTRIYFGANDQPWPPKPKPIIEHIEGALSEQWYLAAHIHNHYESAAKNYVGAMAPSKPDVHYYKVLKQRFGLQKAIITNGFSTVVISNHEFEKLNSN